MEKNPTWSSRGKGWCGHDSPLQICWSISWTWGWELILLRQFVVFSEQMGGDSSVMMHSHFKNVACYNHPNGSFGTKYKNGIKCGHCGNGSCARPREMFTCVWQQNMHHQHVGLLVLILKTVLFIIVWNQFRQKNPNYAELFFVLNILKGAVEIRNDLNYVLNNFKNLLLVSKTTSIKPTSCLQLFKFLKC